MNPLVVKNQKALRCGYTTGSCAAAAASAATKLLLTGQAPTIVRLPTPKGVMLMLPVEAPHWKGRAAVCAVRKDSGDDPDATNGIRIFATVEHIANGFVLCGGTGVGKVTKPGLACPVGSSAINPGPRKQIEEAVWKAAKGFSGGIRVTISAENGQEIAKKTFNARLGIEGGISILGTTGIVEPMSEQALIDTIHTELDCRYAAGEQSLLVCPGNYGLDFARETLGVDLSKAVTISNFIGETLDYTIYKGFSSLLFIGHAGKLIKLAAGVMQTHSSYADGRQEIFAAHAALCGAAHKTVKKLMESITVDECLKQIQGAGLAEQVLKSIGKKIEEHLQKRTRDALQTEFILFTNTCGELMRSQGAEELLQQFQERDS